MSFVMYIIVGLFVGAVLSSVVLNRFSFGVLGSVAIGLGAAIAGGVIGTVIAGDPLTRIGTASAGGAAIAGMAVVALVAGLAHRRYIRERSDRAPARRRALRY